MKYRVLYETPPPWQPPEGYKPYWFCFSPPTIPNPLRFHRASMDVYTGHKDKNGVEVYKKDIIECTVRNHKSRYLGAYVECLTRYEFKVIGNLYQNPRLMKDEYKKFKQNYI